MTKETLLGCLYGGAIGDALGAPIEFMSLFEIRQKYGDAGLETYDKCYGGIGMITDDTQMALFTLEGMMRAKLRWLQRGICSIEAVVYHAYLRWLSTQDKIDLADKPEFVRPGWLIRQRALHHQRAPGNSCLSSLRSEHMGSTENPINNSKGCGGIMRIAPVGLILDEPFETACNIAALTHGHPTGYLTAGYLAELIYRLKTGASLLESIESATEKLVEYPDHEETLNAIEDALNLAAGDDVSPEVIERLGGGWIAEEALAISLFCAIKAENFREGVLMAVNHSGDSDSTGAITGNILGMTHGVDGIPVELIANLEVSEIVYEMAVDALVALELPSEDCFGWVNPDKEQEAKRRILLDKYPPN